MKYTLVVPLLLTLLRRFSGAVLTNETFDDTSPSIVYEPTSSWFTAVGTVCSECPDPTDAIDHTYHYGSHVVGPDADDNPTDTAIANNPPQDPDAGKGGDPDSGDPDSGDPDSGDPDSGEHGGKGKGGKSRSLLRRADEDDPNFVDVPVNATFTFTGTGVYVYCIIPFQNNNNSTNPLTTNITFNLDGITGPPFIRHPQTGPPALFNFSQLVFQSSGLSNESHKLVISPLLNSMMMLDFIDVTTDSDPTSTPSQSSAGTDSSPSPAPSPDTKPASKKNAETFAIAIGSTTGVLAVISFIVAVNLYLRRRRSAKREKLREAQEESLRPEMRGPQPFIPRFFPGTIVSQTSGTTSTTSPSTSVIQGSSLSRQSSQSSMGPSHGLNYPFAPDIPAYSPPTSDISEVPRPLPVSIALRAPVARLPDDDDTVPPSYQEVGQTTLLSTPVFGASQQPAPSFTDLSPTRQPLMLSSSEPTVSESDDVESTPEPSISIRSNIPLILADDEDTPSGLRRSRSNSGSSGTK